MSLHTIIVSMSGAEFLNSRRPEGFWATIDDPRPDVIPGQEFTFENNGKILMTCVCIAIIHPNESDGHPDKYMPFNAWWKILWREVKPDAKDM